MRLTIKNPQNSNTYRIQDTKIRQENGCAFGDAVDRLGEYEDLGTLEELKRYKKEYKKRTYQPR